MNKYDKQVSITHYQEDYDSIDRFVSYFNQVQSITQCGNQIDKKQIDVLEIGVGTGFLRDYLSHKPKYSYKSFDVAEDLKPDFVGDITAIDKTTSQKFDIVCCFEVLEHIKYEDVPKAIEQMTKTSSKYVVISVPQVRLYWSLWTKLPTKKGRSKLIALPLPLEHKFDGQHYWELGKKGTPIKQFVSLLNQHLKIEKQFTDPLNPYHRFFICSKK